MVEYCSRCVMPTTRPGVVLDKEGVCGACLHAEYKKQVDWVEREKIFRNVRDEWILEDHNHCTTSRLTDKSILLLTPAQLAMQPIQATDGRTGRA